MNIQPGWVKVQEKKKHSFESKQRFQKNVQCYKVSNINQKLNIYKMKFHNEMKCYYIKDHPYQQH